MRYFKSIMILLLLTGCEPQKVTVVSTSRLGEMEEYSYKITSLQEGEPDYNRVETYMHRAMEGVGFYPANEGQIPAVVVDVAYGTEEAMAMRTVTKNIEIRTPLSISTRGVILPQTRTMQVEMNEPFILYTKRLEVAGSEPSADAAPVFVVYVEIKSDEDNMREVIPVLVAVALKNLDKTSDKIIKVNPNDPELTFILSSIDPNLN